MSDETTNLAPGSPQPSSSGDQANAEVGSSQTADRESPEVELDEAGNTKPVEVDDTEELEHDGKKYRIPKAVKPLLMLNADYTRKTQELADKGKGLDSERDTFTKSVQAERQILAEGHEVVALNWQIKQLEGIDFNALQQQDPQRAQQLFWQLNQLKGTRDEKVRELQQKIGDRQSQQERESASRADQAEAVLARDVEGWSPELRSKLVSYAVKDLGFTAQELSRIEDPRTVKLLHSAYVGAQAIQKLKTAGTPPAVQPTPTRTVSGGGQAAPSGLSDRASTETWIKARNAQQRKQRA